MSKFSFDVLQKSVFPFVETDDPDVLLGAAFGEDVALTRVGNDVLVSHLDPIVGAIGNIGWLAVHVACNDIAASGVRPRWILVLVLIPDPDDHELLGQIMSDIRRAAREISVSIIGGHTGYSSNLTRPLVAVTALATAAGRTPVQTTGARPGDSVLITKGVGLEGTAILANDFEDIALQVGLSHEEIGKARRLMTDVSVVEEAMILADHAVTAMHDVTRGGLLETLLEIAHLSGVGVEIDADRLPVPSIVRRFADAFAFDPMQMISSGTLAVTIPPEHVPSATKALMQMKVNCAECGHVIQGTGVHLRRGAETRHYHDLQCEQDELARLWTLYPRR
jgi:hydrogenase expression/formation protein HypE